ncbi:ATP-binding cassette domain-containing protein [Georgenia thermotolerans]|uniref:ATP-binding cassette domain-containing protein n=2 Tax=Georgenia thermotolerans TaxID=527326 RepID=A0A7J5UN73_9MICO|nr:ATP-binding cassette domain-containing protein [Georgenia thermotolerans]
MMFMMVPRAQVSAERIGAVLATEPEIVAPAEPVRLATVGAVPAGGAGAPGDGWRGGNGFHGGDGADVSRLRAGDGALGRHDGAGGRAGRLAVELDGATFGYAGAQAPVLRDVTLRLEPGRTTAVIGSTGAGKTTLVNLVPRLIDVTAGAVRLGGVDVRDLDPHDLREHVALVPQKAYLFSGTVASTLRHGRPDATDAELWEALEVAQARDFVEALPGGLDAPVEQGGTNFSGGQRQRLAIARALVRRADIYLFDDSFSALDYATDARLRAALPRATRGAAVLVVAQRVATIRDAETIVVLDAGQVVGTGTHHELMDTNATYQEIVLSQLSAEEAA